MSHPFWCPDGGAVKEPLDDAVVLAFFRAIAAQAGNAVSRMLGSAPELACAAMRSGASRQCAQPFFLDEIRHYVYAGDTALHVAAASYQLDIAQRLVIEGAHVRARNRRGAEPLHYATSDWVRELLR